jgi:CrcB protein
MTPGREIRSLFVYFLSFLEVQTGKDNNKLEGYSMTVNPLLLLGGVGISGALGAVARYLLGRFIAERSGSQIPWGTLIINITGAFLIGLVFSLTAQKVLSPAIQSLLATGFLGGYTTFSTMDWEGVQLAHGGSIVQCFLYVGGTFLFGLLAETLGMLLGRSI